ncbi:hypothetical protein H4S08_004855 [Coemansia sp. RSA 1365]|nr:hypothetical protein H4S08_004855 [Coemansia sp. RSA 1365]
MASVVDVETRDTIRQFLDGHFTTIESLEQVGELLSAEKHTHTQLEEETRLASRRVDELSVKAAAAANSVHEKALELIDIHSQIAGSITDSNASNWEFGDGTAVMDFVGALASNLQTYWKLRQAKEYMDVVLKIEQIAERAAQALPGDTQGIVSALSKAVELLSKHGGSANQEGAQQLAKHIRQTVRDIWENAERAAADGLGESLRKMRWPGKVDQSLDTAMREFDASFSMLARLEYIARESESELQQNGVELLPEGAAALPLRHLARAVDIRMRFHFESARETSRADKPELWLSRIMGMVRNMVPLLESHVQDLYDRTGLAEVDVRSKFIELVLPIVERKLVRDREEYQNNGLIVAQVARELAGFEQTLRDVYFFDGAGVLDRFLNDAGIFGAWVEAERSRAIKLYMEAIAAPDAFEPVYAVDVVGADEPRPSQIAQRVVMLIEDIGERYEVIPSCMQRLQMLATAQFPLIIALVEDLDSELDEFSRVSLAFMRDAVEGTSGSTSTAAQLKQLAAWYHTTWFVEEAACDWNCFELYVAMWAGVCRHAATRGSDTDPRDWREGCDAWDERDQRLLDETLALDSDDWLDGGIWERTIGTLGALRQRILELMGRAISKDVISQLRAYRKKTTWATEDENRGSVSAVLSVVILELAHLVENLSELVPYTALVRVLRGLANEVDSFLVDRVACAHSFNMNGGEQFATDVRAFDRVISLPIEGGLRVLPQAYESARILCCPASSTDSTTSDMTLALDEWAPTVLDPAIDEGEALMVLAKLGIRRLALNDVRRLVRTRVDFDGHTIK